MCWSDLSKNLIDPSSQALRCWRWRMNIAAGAALGTPCLPGRGHQHHRAACSDALAVANRLQPRRPTCARRQSIATQWPDVLAGATTSLQFADGAPGTNTEHA